MRLRVDWRANCSLVGTVVEWLAVPTAFPLALFYGEGIATFVATVALAVVEGTGYLPFSPRKSATSSS